MKETVTCWIQREAHNRLKVFCALHRLSMMQVITQAVKEWLEQHGSNLGDEALQVLQRGNPMKYDRCDSLATSSETLADALEHHRIEQLGPSAIGTHRQPFSS